MRTKWMLEDDLLPGVSDFPVKPVNAITFHPNTVPDYLTEHYWWAYIHPKAVRFFERQWLVNLILSARGQTQSFDHVRVTSALPSPKRIKLRWAHSSSCIVDNRHEAEIHV
jgi:hypothetical protein